MSVNDDYVAYAPVIMDALADASQNEANGAEVVAYLTDALEEEGFRIVRKSDFKIE